MAELQASVMRQALQQLEDHLTCPICFNSFSKPRLLNCAHVFCEECIQRMVKPVRQGRSLVSCPCCCKETPLPQGGVASLQQAFYVNSLAEIQGTLEKVGESEAEDPIPSAPYREDLIPSVLVSLCSVHDKELEFYCETCSIVICSHCTVNQHRGHQFELKDDKVATCREELLTDLKPVNDQLFHLGKVLEGLDDDSRLIVEQRSSLEAKMNVIMDSSFKELRSKKANLINEVYFNAQGKLQKILAMKKKILDAQGELKDCTSLCDKELMTKDQIDVAKAKITACIEKMAKLELHQTSDLDIFLHLTQAVGKSDENLKIYATGMGLTAAQVGNFFLAAYCEFYRAHIMISCMCSMC